MNLTRFASAFVASGLAGSMAIAGQMSLPEPNAVNRLKSSYLLCDRASTAGALDSSQIKQCSVVYEELKRRAFGGDYDKLRAWSRSVPRH